MHHLKHVTPGPLCIKTNLYHPPFSGGSAVDSESDGVYLGLGHLTVSLGRDSSGPIGPGTGEDEGLTWRTVMMTAGAAVRR